MTQKQKDPGVESEQTAADAPVTAGADELGEAQAEQGAAEASNAESEPTLESLSAALEEAREARSAAEDRALRAMAESENVRKRSEKAIENAHKFALESFATALLPVLDSFEKAVEAARSVEEASDDSLASTVHGIELSLKLFADVLEKGGIKAIDPVGEPFDPEFHQAMSMVDSPDAEPGSVIQVVQKGYSLHDRLIRAAMVLVAKGEASDEARS